MFQIEREKAILESLKDGKVAKPKDLCELTGASDVTIRRDLRRLEKRGLIRRWHGCAQIAGGESAWFPAAGMASPEKERVARIAAQLVCDGIIFSLAPAQPAQRWPAFCGSTKTFPS